MSEGEEEEKVRKCPFCGGTFDTREALSKHMDRCKYGPGEVEAARRG